MKTSMRADTTFSCALILFLLALAATTGCSSESPRDDFRSQLADDVEELVEMLEDFRPGTVKIDQTVLTSEGQAASKVEVPRAVVIGGRIKSLGNYFNEVSLALLLEDLSTYDEWGAELKADVARHRAQLQQETDYLTQRVQEDPDAYTKPFKDDFYGGLDTVSAYAPVYGFGLESLVIDEGGEVYFVPGGGDTGYSPKGLFDFDIDAWLESVKAQSLSMQSP